MWGLFVKRLVFSFNLLVVSTDKVMTAAEVSTWERPCVCFVDVGFEVFLYVRMKSVCL